MGKQTILCLFLRVRYADHQSISLLAFLLKVERAAHGLSELLIN